MNDQPVVDNKWLRVSSTQSLLSCLVLSVVAVLAYSITNEANERDSKLGMSFVLAIIVVSLSTVFMLNYLKPKTLVPIDQILADQRRQRRLSRIKMRAASTIDIPPSIPSDSKSPKDTYHLRILRDTFLASRERLTYEISALVLRGNINLVIGALLILCGTGGVAWHVFSTPESQDLTLMTMRHLPRVALAIFIQVFGFFFLRLYKSSLEGIKYFQNELTNVEMKYMAISTAFTIADGKTLEAIVRIMAKTERNFVLQAGQTTVDIEKAKIDIEQHNTIFSKLLETLKLRHDSK